MLEPTIKKNMHINIRYFFVEDRFKSSEVNIKYYPMDDMIGDYFTKPLQGAKFRKFIEKILNVQSSNDGLNPTEGSDPKECVRY